MVMGGKRAAMAGDMGAVTLVTSVGISKFEFTLKTYGRHSVPWCVAAQLMCRDSFLCRCVLSCISSDVHDKRGILRRMTKH